MEAEEGLLGRRNSLEDLCKDLWVVPWPLEISMQTRVIVLTWAQTYLLLLFTLFAALIPLQYFQIFIYLVAWTAFLVLLVILVAVHVFQALLEDSPGLGFRLFAVTSVCEGLAFLLLAPNCPVVVMMLMAFSCAGHTTLSLNSMLFTGQELQKHGPRLILCTLLAAYLVVISFYPLAYIFLIFLLPINCIYLVLSLDDAVEVSREIQGGWKRAGQLALKLQARKFAYPFRLLPQEWKTAINYLLPVQDRRSEPPFEA